MLWDGRIDSEVDEASFRFHQRVILKSTQLLAEGEHALSLIGFESDEGVKRNNGRVGAAFAPNEIRKGLAKLPFNLDKATRVIDTGNVACENGDLEQAQHVLGEQVAKLFHHSCTPIIIGGGHETLYGHYLGVREFFGSDVSLGVINIDAHFDMRESEVPSSGTMFKQILDEDPNAGYLCLGIQKFGNTKALFNIAKTYGCEYIMEENLDFDDSTKQVIDVFTDAYDYVLLTLCTDSINASAAPGVSAPSPFGLDPKLVRSLLCYIVTKENVTSFDISEVNPRLDESDKTTRLAANLIAEVMQSFERK